MVKQPTAEQSEFQMSSEDFPALPGTQSTDGTVSSNSLGIPDGADKGTGGAAGVGMDLQTESVSVNDKAFKRGVQTSPDGTLLKSDNNYSWWVLTNKQNRFR